jgi:transcriptional regulator with XRE-family HTH domain
MEPTEGLLRELRERAGLTQAELAQRTGIGQPVLSLYESGRREPRADVFIRLVEALGYAIEFTPLEARSPMPERLVARVLPDVLGLADAMPRRRRAELAFPRLPPLREPVRA